MLQKFGLTADNLLLNLCEEELCSESMFNLYWSEEDINDYELERTEVKKHAYKLYGEKNRTRRPQHHYDDILERLAGIEWDD